MKIEVIDKETRVAVAGDSYRIHDKYLEEAPSVADYAKHMNAIKHELDGFKTRSAFRDESALCLLNVGDDTPCWLVLIEVSNGDAVNMQTIEFIASVIDKINPRFSVFVTFEYNYIGFDFSCVIEKGVASFCIRDDMSKEMFGLQ